MKKLISLAIAVTLVLSAAFNVSAAEINPGLNYNIIVNGKACDIKPNEAINADGATMLLPTVYVNAFRLTEEKVQASGDGFAYEGQEYYSLRDVAKANNLSIFWDKATSTALVIDTQKLADIKALMDSANHGFDEDMKLEMALTGNMNIDITSKDVNQKLDVPLDALIQMDIKTPFMYMDMKTSLMGSETAIQLYDDGTYSYVYEQTSDKWIKTDSSLKDSLSMSEQLKLMMPYIEEKGNPESSLAALTMTKQGSDTIIEGDMYVADIYESFDFEKIFSSLPTDQTELLEKMNMEFIFPDTMYVKYVFDKDNNIKEIDMKCAIGLSFSEGDEAMVIMATIDFCMPKFSMNAEFDTTVPQDVVDKAVSMDDLLKELE